MRRLLHHPTVRKHASQAIKFAVVGGTGAIMDLSSLTFFVEVMRVDDRFAVIPSTLIAVVFVFIANKYFTFKNREKNTASQALKFAFVYGVAIISNIAISALLITLGLHYFLAKVIAIGVGAVWNYALSQGFVFKQKGEVDVAIV
jgi:putative flippase GtrA